MDITLTNVTHVYMEKTPFEKKAISDIDMHIPSGSFVAIIGHTGSGKSTLIQHFNGLLRPSNGTVKIGNTIITKEKSDLHHLRKKVGMVFQYPEHQLFEETIYKDVAYGPLNYDLPEQMVSLRVKEALNSVGMNGEEWSDRSPFELSGGQMRRVAIAGVLAMQPEVLVLDEPTAGLDPKGKQMILDLIAKLHQEENMTIILVTHNMEDAARFAERLYVMDQGQVAITGSPQEIFKHDEELRRIGLDIPDITKFIMKLNKRIEPSLPLDIFHMEDLEKELVQRITRKGSSSTL